jgi:hypothetical protein
MATAVCGGEPQELRFRLSLSHVEGVLGQSPLPGASTGRLALGRAGMATALCGGERQELRFRLSPSHVEGVLGQSPLPGASTGRLALGRARMATAVCGGKPQELRFRLSPSHVEGVLGQSPLPGGGYPLEILVTLDAALAYDFSATVDQVEFAEFFILILQIDSPVAAAGGSGIGTPGRSGHLREYRVSIRVHSDGNGALLGNGPSRFGRLSLAAN